MRLFAILGLFCGGSVGGFVAYVRDTLRERGKGKWGKRQDDRAHAVGVASQLMGSVTDTAGGRG